MPEIPAGYTEIEDGVYKTMLWMRRQRDGKCFVCGVLSECHLLAGVNDAFVLTTLVPVAFKDATVEGLGRSVVDILERGLVPRGN